jgi:EpsI family protein
VSTLVGGDVALPEAELEVAGVTDYVMRVYRPQAGAAADAGAPWISVYVGYYEMQTRGRTIHSPKNCMPGAGWQALESRTVAITAPDGATAEVNRYLLVNEEQRVLVLYWYQGRGRVVASEYRAKWDLLRDASLKRRSDEALVRIVVPIVAGEEHAFEVARDAAIRILPTLTEALPAA